MPWDNKPAAKELLDNPIFQALVEEWQNGLDEAQTKFLSEEDVQALYNMQGSAVVYHWLMQKVDELEELLNHEEGTHGRRKQRRTRAKPRDTTGGNLGFWQRLFR